MRALQVSVYICVLFSIFPACALSGVSVGDTIAVEGQEVMIRAETRGTFFAKGGEVVEFLVDGKSIGKNLSGGDGVAFKQFTPKKTGLHRITARSGGYEDTGLLLSLERGSSIVFVDIEGSLLEGLFSQKPRHGAKKAIKSINTGFPIVFLQTGFLKVKVLKVWLKKNGFPELPVVRWRRGAVFREVVKSDLRIKAIIGGPGVIESAKEHKPLAFCFEKVDDAEWVEDWEEISEELKVPEDEKVLIL